MRRERGEGKEQADREEGTRATNMLIKAEGERRNGKEVIYETERNKRKEEEEKRKSKGHGGQRGPRKGHIC